MRIPQLLAGLAVAASFAALGCGEAVIDSAKVEKSIGKSVIDQTGVRVKSVSCPKDRAVKKGDTFTCTVVAKDDTKGKAVVTQRDDKGNLATEAPFLHIRGVEGAIAEQIKQQTKATVTVACPEIVVPKTGAKFRCEASDGKLKRQVETTMTDARGNLRFKLL
jgi:Domain of unknown function (DUF4333)